MRTTCSTSSPRLIRRPSRMRTPTLPPTVRSAASCTSRPSTSSKRDLSDPSLSRPGVIRAAFFAAMEILSACAGAGRFRYGPTRRVNPDISADVADGHGLGWAIRVHPRDSLETVCVGRFSSLLRSAQRFRMWPSKRQDSPGPGSPRRATRSMSFNR